MANNLYGSICLSDIPKQYITTGKNGKKYIQVNIWANRDGEDRFGNTHSVQVALNKEQREKDGQKYYIGNMKESARPQSVAPSNPFDDNDSGLPF